MQNEGVPQDLPTAPHYVEPSVNDDDRPDLGFQSPDFMSAEHALGQVAMAYEDHSQNLYDQANANLMKAQTTLAFIQGDLVSKAAADINTMKDQHGVIANDLEVAAAGQLGGIATKASAIVPQDAVISALTSAAITYPIIINEPSNAAQSSILQDVGHWASLIPCADADALFGANSYVIKVVMALNPFGSSTWVLKASTDNIFKYYLVTLGQQQLPLQDIQIKFGVCPVPVVVQPPTPFPPPPVPPPVPPPPPPPPPTCPPCPPIKECPVAPKPPEQPCIKLCDQKPPECKTPTYKVYCSDEGKITIVESDKPAPNSRDKLVANGEATSIDWKSVCECGGTKPSQELPESIPPGQIGGITALSCGDIVASRLVSVGESADIIRFITNGLAEGIRSGEIETSNIAGRIVKAVFDIFNTSLAAAYSGLAYLVGTVFTKSGCNPAALTSVFLTKTVTTLSSYVAGNALEAQDTEATYFANSNCQYLLPSISEAIGGYVRNQYSYDQTACLIKANGGRMDLYAQQIEAARSRLSPLETLTAYRRGFIGEADATGNLRALGYYYQAERDVLYKLTEQIPTISDLLPMMVRDVADEVNVDWTESDRIFQEKWTGQIKKWGEEQGISPDWARFAWRYHWQLPSPTQLFEFYARLRHTGLYGTPEEFRAKIRKTLIQQDILPEWVDKYLDIVYKPLTRVDARRAYEIGAIDDDKLRQAYLDQSYSDQNAQTLVDYNKQLVKISRMKNPLINQYVDGGLTLTDLETELQIQGMPTEGIQTVKSAALRKAKYKRRKVCVNSYKKRYMLGELKIDYVKTLLVNEGMELAQVSELTEAWQCERAARGKEIPASILAGWYNDGIITDSIFYQRLLNLGYSADDAATLVADARFKLGQRTRKEELAKIAKVQKEAKANAMLAKRLAKEADTNAAKALAKAESMNAKRVGRKKLIIKAADKIAKRTEVDIADAVIGVQSAVDQAIAAGIGDIDNIHSAAVEVSNDESINDLASFRDSLFHLVLALER